jgi:uncharacterized protein
VEHVGERGRRVSPATARVKAAARRPVAEGVFTWPADEPRLIGSRCVPCGEVTFPARGACPRCTATATEELLLARTGTLWSWTVQCFRPKSPPYAQPEDEEFEPYGVGYVELPGEVRVEARLTEADPARLEIGMAMELVIVPLWQEREGEVVTYAFAPADGDGG